MRPPGHHAETSASHGLLLLQRRRDHRTSCAEALHGLERVAVVDFDVHHGNGTQDIFWSDPTCHVLPRPTRCRSIRVRAPPLRTRCPQHLSSTLPLRAGEAGAEFREAFDNRDPAAAASTFAPEFIVISAGFDAHVRDPLANLNLQEAELGLGGPASSWRWPIPVPPAGIVSVLEGGDDLARPGAGRPRPTSPRSWGWDNRAFGL